VNVAHDLPYGPPTIPERTALLFEGEQIWYRELDRRAGAPGAAALRAKGVRRKTALRSSLG
jgi:non-ribosomal peptide synthetase component F